MALSFLFFFVTTEFASAHMGHLGELSGHSHWIAWGVGLTAAALAALLGKGKLKNRDGENDAQAEDESNEQPEPEPAGA